MNINSHLLLEDLIERTKAVINAVQPYSSFSLDQLNWKTDKESWSILECLEHLNRYGRFYIPEIKQRIDAGKNLPSIDNFKSGWLGNYFANSMLPKAKLNKMKTFAAMNPSGSSLDLEVINEFLDQQRQILDLLDEARTVDLAKIKTSISISRWIKLRLGDTFRVVIYHIQRHLVQMERVAELQENVNQLSNEINLGGKGIKSDF